MIRPGTTLVRRGAAASCVLGLLVLSGCLQGDVEVKIDSDRSGEVIVEVVPDRTVQAALDDVDVETAIDGAFQEVEGVEFDTIDNGDRDGYRLYVPFDDYTELSEVLVAGGSLSGEQVTLFSSFRLTELDDGGWELRATINPLGQIISGTRTDDVPGTVQELLDAAGVGNSATGLDLTVALPGRVTASNAEDVDGGSATWRLDEPDATTELTMRTEPKPPVTPLQMVIGGALLVVVVGVVLSLWSAGRQYRRTEGDRTRKRTARRTAKQAAVAQEAWAPRSTAPSSIDRPEPLPPLAGPPTSPAPVPAPMTSATMAETAPATSVAPGWYPDPQDLSGKRWWDGTDWTEHRA